MRRARGLHPGQPFRQSLTQARNGWKNHPEEMAVKLGLSFIFGQGIFWVIGFDQLGLFMDPKIQLGLGQTIAAKVYRYLPATATVAWTIKALEILADAGKMPIEGAAYRRCGIVPDVVACAVTQPLWSLIEMLEKTAGVILHPERVTHPEQVQLSLGCIYGSLFRYALAGGLYRYGNSVYGYLGEPIARRVRRR